MDVINPAAVVFVVATQLAIIGAAVVAADAALADLASVSSLAFPRCKRVV
jgi:hypothetical protein